MIPFDYPELFAPWVASDGRTAPRQVLSPALRCWGEPCFNIENEPDFVTPYAYVYSRHAMEDEEVVTRIGTETFKLAPDGIPGNDDLGATSGVYVWNALGMYPAVPGVGGLVIGTPMFDKATLLLRGRRLLSSPVQAKWNLRAKRHSQWRGLCNAWLPLSKIRTGTNQLHFTWREPNKQRGSAKPIVRHPSARRLRNWIGGSDLVFLAT